MCVLVCAVLLFLLSGWLPNRVWNFISFFFILFYIIFCYVLFYIYFIFFKFNGTQQFSRWFLCAWRRKKRAFFSSSSYSYSFLIFCFFYYQVYPSVTIVVAIWQIHLSSQLMMIFHILTLFFLEQIKNKKCGESLSIFLKTPTILCFHGHFFCCDITWEINYKIFELKVPCILNHFQHAFCIHDVHLINKLKFKQGK